MSRVWIDPGCIQCGWCANLAPTVFEVSAEGAVVRAEARLDGRTSDNRAERAELRDDALSGEDAAFMPFLAGGCPTSVIRLDGFAAADDPLHVLDG